MDVATVERTLGLTNEAEATLLSLSRRIERGFPLESLTRISRLVAPQDKRFENRIVPASTLKRRRRQHEPLSPEESERVQRIARAWAAALNVYHNEERAREFLTRPHPMLGRQTPLDVALRNTPGLDAVEALFGRAKYELAA
jgi:putative toxin-antitoxin system antitoxin component (TIGR02293 family)